MEKRRCTAIVLAAGQGKRMGGAVRKQYMELGGKPLICYSLGVFQNSRIIDRIILVTGAEDVEYCRDEIVARYGITKADTVIAGGSERYASVKNGLDAIKKSEDKRDADGIVFIHDGVRPFINEEMLQRLYEATVSCHACVAGMPSKDTVKIADADGFVESTPPRQYVWNIQTPQVFDFPLIYRAYDLLEKSGRSDVTDDAMAVEAFTDTKVRLTEGSYDNIKITMPEDLIVAERLLQSRITR